MTVLGGSRFMTQVAVLLALGAGGGGLGTALAQGSPDTNPVVRRTPQQAGALPATVEAPAADESTTTTVRELQQLIQGKRLQELRTTYNSSYGASLLLKPDEQVYYVALFHQQQFWRVIKTSSATRAEQVYQAFVQQTESLADVDIQRHKLDAERQLMAKVLEAKQERLTVLQADLAFQRDQEKQVLIHQTNAREEAQELERQRRETSAQLAEIEKELKRLQEQHDHLPQSVPAVRTRGK